MATSTNGIATRSDLNAIFPGMFDSDLTKCPTKSEINTSVVNVSGTYSSNQLVVYNDISRKAVTVNIKVTNHEINGGTTLNQITLYNGSTTIASKTSGFSSIKKGGSATYTFTIPSDAYISSSFKLSIGKFGAKKRVYYSDVKNTSIDMGYDNTITKTFSFNTNVWLLNNAGKTISLDIYND